MLPLFATRFAAYAGGIRVSLILCSHVSFKSIWNGLHGRYIVQTHLDEIYKHAFYVCAIWDTRLFLLKNYCGFNSKSCCSGVCGYDRCPQSLAEICRNIGNCCGFRAVADRGKYPGFMLFTMHKSNQFVYTRILQWYISRFLGVIVNQPWWHEPFFHACQGCPGHPWGPIDIQWGSRKYPGQPWHSVSVSLMFKNSMRGNWNHNL